ncbi:MAG TPA: fused MFS/spermidine synthase [Bryobacteraceae bacterium]|nr:fused MFS/spermidine synthase [Bryobacteraceae bacterium]
MSKQKLKTPSLKAPAPAPAEIAEPVSRRFLPLLLILFVGSGCAALIYEVVWFQLLQLVIGSSAVSLGVLLGTYMGGMCLGSVLLPRYVSSREHPLRVYAVIEAGIGIFGLVILFGVPMLDSVYAAIAGHGLWGILVRAILAGICLLPPTLLMGASLPAIARWIETTPRGISWLGFFYGGNIAGAVFGCLLAGFYLLRVYDMRTATFVAVAINAAVALVAYRLAESTAYSPSADVTRDVPRGDAPVPARSIYIAIALSGMSALGAEVIWTRLLGLMIGATVYTFSIILAVFLVGLGIGSALASQVSGRTRHPRIALGVCQLLLAAAIAWSAYTLAVSLPNWPVNPLLAKSPWFNFQVDLMRCLWAVFPAACLWGASFPFALAAAAKTGEDSGKLVGEVYAANTIGGIIGAVAFSIVLIPWIGSQDCQRLLIALAAVSALIVFVPLRNSLRKTAVLGLIAAMLVAVWMIVDVAEVPWLAVAYGRRMSFQTNAGRALYVGEGRNSSVAISELPDGKHYFHVSGKVEASTEPYDMRLQRMLGHLPALLHRNPQSVLIVGFGAGVTAGTFVVHPTVQKITICELEPLVPPAATKYFSNENHNVLNDPRTQIFYDDARHFILTSKDKFDIITSDPIHPWVKGTSSLYSKEYFEVVKQHLNPGGIVTQWVPLYESDPETVKSELATFFNVFPNGTVWGNDINGEGYDTVLLGQAEPMKIDLDALDARWTAPENARVSESMSLVAFRSPLDLLTTYAGRASDLTPWLQNAQINDDMSMRLQYLAGMGLNFDRPAVIYSDILAFRRFPNDMFTGSEARMAALRFALSSPGR